MKRTADPRAVAYHTADMLMQTVHAHRVATFPAENGILGVVRPKGGIDGYHIMYETPDGTEMWLAIAKTRAGYVISGRMKVGTTITTLVTRLTKMMQDAIDSVRAN